MRKQIAFVGGIIGGVVGSMTFQTPKDSLSTFARSLQQIFGSYAPTWLDTPITDRVVRVVAFAFGTACFLYLLMAGCNSVVQWWKNREPRYPSPFAWWGAKKILKNMSGWHASIENGIVELLEGDEIVSTGFFHTPQVFRVRAKTSSTNIRFSYVENELIFNWEYKYGILRIDGGPLHDTEVPDVGQIPQNAWVTIDLFYYVDSMRIDVDGDTRWRKNADFSNANTSFSIFTGGHSTIYVKSVLAGIPKEFVNSYRWLKLRRIQILLAVSIGFACGIFAYKFVLHHHDSHAEPKMLDR